ncbi:MAG: 30S ribosomal protein S4 [Clostridia bacterium]|nr:30S ribosomal protein S4 [Clostridia bacterium]
MAKYTDSSCRICRREGAKLFLKGDRCYSPKCAISKRQAPPGQHGVSRKKLSEYGLQLREKQKTKKTYGMLEKQFKNYYSVAESMRGQTGENMLQLLELRLDNVVYRLGLAKSRAQARQIVNHAHITVNGNKVNIPSYICKEGEVIAAKENRAGNKYFAEVKEQKKLNLPKWLEFNPEKLEGKIIALPQRDDIDLTISENMIVELYSK